MNLIMLLMKCERFFRNDYGYALAHSSGAAEERGGGKSDGWNGGPTNNEDSVLGNRGTVEGAEGQTGVPCVFGIDYRGVSLYM